MPRQKSTHVDSPAAVGRRLREARERAGLSQRQLSFEGCSPAYVSRIEGGERIPSLQLLRELGRRLGVTADYLATGAVDRPDADLRLDDAELALRLGEFERAQKLYEGALEATTDAGERARALEGLGKVALQHGFAERAVALLEDALALTGGDAAARPALAETLGRAYATMGELAPAIALFQRCLAHYEEAGDPIGVVRFSCLLGYALTDNGDFAEAERIVAHALTVGQGLADPYTRARLYWSRSRLLVEQGRSAQAERYAAHALDVLRATEDSYWIGLAHQLLAQVYLDGGRPAEAAALLADGRPLVEAAGTPFELAAYEVDEARALAALGDSAAAATLAVEASRKLAEGHSLPAGQSYLVLAGVFEDLGDVERARELYELGIELLERNPPNRYLVAGYRKLADVLERAGRADEALTVLKRALGVQERAGRSIT